MIYTYMIEYELDGETKTEVVDARGETEALKTFSTIMSSMYISGYKLKALWIKEREL